MIEIQQFTCNHFQVNCYLLYHPAQPYCAIVDPGMTEPREREALATYISSHHLTPTWLLLTHAHIDHIAGLLWAHEQYHLPVAMHTDGTALLQQAPLYAQSMGFGTVPAMDNLPIIPLQEGDKLTLQGTHLHATTSQEENSTPETDIEVLYVPGHCPGSLCYLLPRDQKVLTGDALFRMSIGRTDLPGGDYDLLIDKIHSRLLPLPDACEVLPGHGSSSSIGVERYNNPFL